MTPTPTSKSLLASLNILYFSLVATMIAFGLVVLYLNYSGGILAEVDADFALLLRYVLLVMLPVGLGLGYFLFKKLTASIISSISLKEKLFKYQSALLIRSACFEVPGLFASVAALITKDSSFLLFTGIVVALFFLFRPTVFSITTDLNLSQTERSVLENPLSPLT